MSMNEILRHPEAIPAETTFESGLIDSPNVHNMYTHCPGLGHYSIIGVKGENSIIKRCPYQVVLGI